MAPILVVEDAKDLCNVIRTQLEAEGHIVYQAFDGPTALVLVERYAPQLVILDLMLPGLDGLTVCRRIRASHLMPILMLTARTEEADRVLGLEVGADDYVVKPFSMRELLARVRALLRRQTLDSQGTIAPSQPNDIRVPFTLPDPPEPIVCGPMRIEPATHIATLDGVPLDLTPNEFDILLLFVAYPGRVFSRRFLLHHLRGDDSLSLERAVDSRITRLRKKLGPFGEHIATVWGVGYRFTG